MSDDIPPGVWVSPGVWQASEQDEPTLVEDLVKLAKTLEEERASHARTQALSDEFQGSLAAERVTCMRLAKDLETERLAHTKLLREFATQCQGCSRGPEGALGLGASRTSNR